MSHGARLFVGLAVLLVLAGLAARDGRAAALAVPLLVAVGAAVLGQPGTSRLSVSRGLSARRSAAGSPVTVTVTVRNDGPRTEELLVEDTLPAGLACVSGSPRLFTRVPPGQEASWSYVVAGPRGDHGWGAVRTGRRGTLSLLSRVDEHRPASRLLVLPDAVRLRRLAVHPRQTRALAGPVPARMPGSGTVFHGVREYRSGDPRRAVNARLTSRSVAALYVNELEQERIADIGIVLDARERSYPSAPDLFEAAVLAAGSLAGSFLADGSRVALLVYGHSWDRTPPGLGRAQRERIREQLARARTGVNDALQSLGHLPTRMFPARSQVILVSPLDPEDAPVLSSLHALGYSVAVVSPDPAAAEERARAAELAGPRGAVLRGALRLARLERALLVTSLRRSGVPVADWVCGDDPAASLRSCLARQPLSPGISRAMR